MWQKQSSRKQIRILEIRDDILVLPGNKYRVILETSSLNLELKSEDEQDQITQTFANFLNSLATGIQIVVRTRAIDMEQYLEGLRAKVGQGEGQTELVKYAEFVRRLVIGSKILTRRFYIVIPFTQQKNEKASFDYVREQLGLSKNLVVRGLAKMGIWARPLGGLEIAQLFYSFYNPDTYKMQKLADWVLREGNI